MIGMDGDPVDESAGGALGADQDADWVGAREGDHAAAAPDLKVADGPLERGRRHQRLVSKVGRPRASPRVNKKSDVARTAEAVRPHAENSQHPPPNSQFQLPQYDPRGRELPAAARRPIAPTS